MTFVKICGITCPDDARHAADCGADAIGLVFAAGSPRRVDPAAAAAITTAVHGRTACVGVFRDHPADEVDAIRQQVQLDYLQFHGDESPEFCRQFAAGTWYKAFWWRDDLDPGAVAAYGESCFLLDGALGDRPVPDRWPALRDWARRGRLVVAGGLDPDNVGAVVREVAPYGVDVSRGVELRPGVKDAGRVERFVRRVRQAERGGDP